MALGEFGSTLNDELNRLANGGTYRTMPNQVDNALAAKQWANRENINPYSTDTVGILNEIAGLGTDKKNWLDFNGVCNYIAGTTGLPAAAALRQVYPTTDLLTGVASYYVDAVTPRYNYPGYLSMSGIDGDYLSTPDSNALDITGAIDLQVKVMLPAVPPAKATTTFIQKGTTNNLSYTLFMDSSGLLGTLISTNGTGWDAGSYSTVPVSFSANTVKWLRATFTPNNGSGSRENKFFTSDDGVTWTQLGATVTGASVSGIFSGNAQVGIAGGSQGVQTVLGRFYRAIIKNGIDGTTVLDVNAETNITSATMNTFIATTGQLCTINGQDTVTNGGAAGSLLPTTLGSSTAADSNDPKFLDFTGTNYVYLPGVAGNYLSVPNAAPLQITGDIDLRAQVALDSWTPTGDDTLISKFGAGGNRSYRFTVTSTGNLSLIWSADGTNLITATSSVATGIANGTTKWVRATLDVDNGASGNSVQFFTSDNGTTWTQLGTTVTTAGVTSIFNSTWTVDIGTDGGAARPLDGKLFRAQIFNGIDGTKVLDVDTSVITAGSQTSFTAVTGQTVTINRSTSGRKTVAVTQPTWLFGTDDYMEVNNRYMSSGTYLYLPGVASNYASTPDSAAVSITGDIDLRVKVAMDDWTPSTGQVLLAKRTDTTNVSYALVLASNGTLVLNWSVTGSSFAILTATSTVAPTITDGSTLWVRATLDVDNGSSGKDVIFYTSTDGSTWTQLGSTVTSAGTTSIYDGTAALEIGSWITGTNPARGKFYRAQVRNGINGTVAFDANFETSITSLNQASFTESSANAATVTINRSGSTYRSAGITTAGYLYPGATNTFTASATDFLNFGASDSFTAVAVYRQWGNAAVSYFLSKATTNLAAISGWMIYNATANGPSDRIGDGTTRIIAGGGSTSYGSNVIRSLVRNKSTNTLQTFIGTTAQPSFSDTSGSLVNRYSLQIGNLNSDNPGFNDMEFIAGAVFRTALTASQIRQINNYFANREVYL